MSDLKVRLSGFLPAAEMDGLQPLLTGLVLAPKDRRIIVGVIDTAMRRDHGDGEYEPTVRILQVEVPQGELADQAQQLLRQAYAQRTGAMQVFEDDGTEQWGIGGQAGRPLTPEEPDSGRTVGDQADPDGEPWQTEEPPAPVQDQVAKRRSRKQTDAVDAAAEEQVD